MKSASKSKPKPRRDPAPLPAVCDALMGKDQILTALAISPRKFASMRSAAEFPPPDLHIGDLPRWRVTTYNAWVIEQSQAKRTGA